MQSSRTSSESGKGKVILSDAELRELGALSLHVLSTAGDGRLLNVDTLSRVVQHAVLIVDLLKKDNPIEIYPQFKKRFYGKEEGLDELEWRAIVSAHLFLAKSGIDLSLHIKQKKAQSLFCLDLTAACYAEGKHTDLLLKFATACADIAYAEGGDKASYISVAVAKADADAQNNFRMVRYLTAQNTIYDLPLTSYSLEEELLSSALTSIKFATGVETTSLFRRANSGPARLQSKVETEKLPSFIS